MKKIACDKNKIRIVLNSIFIGAASHEINHVMMVVFLTGLVNLQHFFAYFSFSGPST